MKISEKAIFFDQFAALLNSGIGVQQSLNAVAKNSHPSFASYLRRVSVAMDTGTDLASAIALDSSYFDGWTIALIRLAEYSGALPEVCQRLAISAKTQQRQQKLYGSIRLAAIAIVWSLLVLIVVIFKKQPSGFLKLDFWLNSLGLGLLLLGVSFVVSRYPQHFLPRLAKVIPGLNKIIEARSLINFAQLAIPLSCGVPLLTALDLLRDRISSVEMRANVTKASQQIRNGKTLTQSLQNKLPPIAIQMILTGEETGNIDAALQRLATYYEGELERSVRQLESILKVLSLLSFGILIAVLAIRLFVFLTNSLPT